jgi:serine/threonine protein kinase
MLALEEAFKLGARAPSAGAAPPSRIGRYEVVETLGQGGMGAILRGRDPDLGRVVVLKTLRPSLEANPKAVERLRREARIAGRLEHPGICGVLDVVADGGREYVVLPYIEGESLARVLDRARDLAAAGGSVEAGWSAFPRSSVESDAGVAGTDSAAGSAMAEKAVGDPKSGDLRGILRLLEKVAHAAHCAHEAGIVHRDLKPANIIVRPSGEPVVLDFGLALDTSSASLRLTEEGDVLGTPIYMAPEQVEGRLGAIDRRTDVYALGVILYEALTMKVPFEARSRAALFQRILRGEPTPPRRLNSAVPRDLEAVCLKAMAAEATRRYASTLEMAEDLRRVRTLRPTLAKPPSAMGRVWRRVRRSPLVTAAAALCVLLVVALAVVASRWSRSRGTVDCYAAATRILMSVSRQEELRAEDLEALAILLPSEAARVRFRRDPLCASTWEEIERLLAGLPRTDGDRATIQRLISPRAAVAELRPTFRFEVPPPGGEEWHYRLTLSAPDRAARTFQVVQQAGDAGPLAFTLPAGEALTAGVEYTWTVSLDEERHREFAGLYQPQAAAFLVLGPETRERILKDVRATGHEALDRVLRAAALNANRLAADALSVLDGFPADAAPQERALAAVLRAEAHALLDERDAVEQLKKAVTGGADGASPSAYSPASQSR